jgi:hypothetical protein
LCGIFTLLIFHDTVSTRARHAAKGGITPAKPGSGERSSPPGAEREKFALLNSSRECWKLSVPFLPLAPATEYTLCEIFTLLIFHDTVSTRARRRAKPARPRRSRGSAACGGAPGAEREKFSLLNSPQHPP